MNEIKIGIVVLNYNTWQDTHKCIESIRKYSSCHEYIIYLVDNFSPIRPTAEILEAINKYHVVYIQNKVNSGFSAGNNIGIQAAMKDCVDFILLTNSDVIFLQDSIDKMVDYMAQNPQIGVVGPRIFLPNGCEDTRKYTRIMGMKERYIVTTAVGKIFPSYIQDYFGINEISKDIYQVAAVSGCCFMISAGCINAIGKLDENTFMYEEENILSHKLKNAGYQATQYRKAEIIHNQGSSTNTLKALSYKWAVESELYFCKNYSNANLISIFPLYCYRIFIYICRCIVNHDYRKCCSQFMGCTAKRFWRKNLD